MTTITKGSWQDSLVKSSATLDRSDKARKQAGALLFNGAQIGIEEWIDGGQDADATGEALYNECLSLLGERRKGDASKIKTVALAVRDKGLVMGDFETLNGAYNEARRLTKGAEQEAEEDSAADEAAQAIEAPRTTSKPEGAAQIVMSQGADEAARLLLDALGADNTPAHRAFARAVQQEIAGRITAKAKAEAEAKAAEAQAKREAAKAERERVAAEKKAERAKAAAEKKAEAAKNKASKPAPAKKAAPAKATPVKAKAKPAPAKVEADPVESDDDLFEDFDMEDEVTETPAPKVKATPVKAKPVARPVKR